jgi:hypothetical protein
VELVSSQITGFSVITTGSLKKTIQPEKENIWKKFNMVPTDQSQDVY